MNSTNPFPFAGLTQEERNRKQEAWLKNTTRVIVCTNAFGMGIDKPDVRVVWWIFVAFYALMGLGVCLLGRVTPPPRLASCPQHGTIERTAPYATATHRTFRHSKAN